MKSRKEKSKLKTTDIVYIGVFAAVIAVCSWISIPLTVPITLQTMGICVCAGLLGAKRGALSVLVYMLIGLIGLPVFSNFTFFTITILIKIRTIQIIPVIQFSLP